MKRAASFYEKRRLHELKVDQQLSQLQLVERRLADARQRVAELQAESPVRHRRRQGGSAGWLDRSQSRQLDELSLQSFEIAGACEHGFMKRLK